MKCSVGEFFDPKNAPLIVQSVDLPVLKEHQISLNIVRDDLFHPMIAGNKWWKLKHTLIHAAKQEIPRLVTFGGAYSNHILALAGAGHLFGFETIGIIRGEEIRALNPVLAQAEEWGMRLEPISRALYKQKHRSEFLKRLKEKWSPCMIIPEGGTGPLAIKGSAEMVSRLGSGYDYLCCPVGTGGTLAGMVLGAPPDAKILGFSALKKGSFLVSEVNDLLQEFDVSDRSWSIQTDFHFGGYARSNELLRTFCESFLASQHITLDLVYTGKMLFGILELIRNGYFKVGARIAAWHTGNVHGLECSRLGMYSLKQSSN